MKAKKIWHIITCTLLTIIITIGCICWAKKDDANSESSNPTAITSTSASTITTLTSGFSTTSTTLATTTTTLPPTTYTKAKKATVTQTTSHSKSSSSNPKTNPTHCSVDLSGMEYINGEYFDKSNLTFTQADVGKIVGYSPGMARDIIVCSVDETPTVDGRRAVCLLLGYRGIDGFNYCPSEFCIVECEYCHEFPCSKDGDKNCPKYDPLIDASVTCQDCGLPRGNGYYGTCYGIIDWDNGAITICNHYSNCLKCGRPVGDGYNGTCHVTWGVYPGVTTCNHYD